MKLHKFEIIRQVDTQQLDKKGKSIIRKEVGIIYIDPTSISLIGHVSSKECNVIVGGFIQNIKMSAVDFADKLGIELAE